MWLASLAMQTDDASVSEPCWSGRFFVRSWMSVALQTGGPPVLVEASPWPTMRVRLVPCRAGFLLPSTPVGPCTHAGRTFAQQRTRL